MKKLFKKIRFLETFLTVVIIMGITTILFLYTSGYRLSRGKEKPLDLNKTGMISAKSIPDGASVYLDGKITTATNDTIPGVKPGIHNLRIVKKGFVEWQKDIEVFEQLVTDMTAVLVSQSPRLEPLTNTGAKFPAISHTLNKLAYFSNDDEKPGIWIIPLSGSNALNIFRSNSTIAIQNTKYTKYSEGKSIEWSPDEKQLLTEANNNSWYLIDLETNTAQTTTSPEITRKAWSEILIKKRTDLIDKLELPENIKQLALSPKTVWSPDDKKFLYTVQNGNQLDYRIYNMEKPLPVGERSETLAFTTNSNDRQPKISWYSDSFHLIVVEGDVEKNQKGIISLVRIDGSNKIEAYNNTLFSDTVYSVPGGDKVIIVTSYKSDGQTNLYTIAIR
jgi:hypothetical protein